MGEGLAPFDFSAELNEGTAISDVDGRYRETVGQLANYFSEAALQRYRVFIESNYLLALSKFGVTRKLSPEEAAHLDDMALRFDYEDFKKVKQFEKETRHDVKAVEYFVKSKLLGSMADIKEMVHFGLTSEDITGNAMSLSLRDSRDEVMLPAMLEVLEKVTDLAEKYKSAPMLARTHGQPASPTTVGKEFANVAYRLSNGIWKISEIRFPGKLNGATGNFNAHVATYPDVDWVTFSDMFIYHELGLEYVPCTTQILPHDEASGYFREVLSLNKILEGFDQDCWRYISDDWFKQKVNETETGSSTMPHKVNPIDFENSEGNLQASEDLLAFLADKQQISRLQRDLSGSTITRKYGVALGYALLGYKNLSKGLGKIEPNTVLMEEVVMSHPELIAEPIQSILRTKGYDKPYEALKKLTRGRKVAAEEMTDFVKGLDVDAATKERLLNLSPKTYTGVAEKITEKVVKRCRRTMQEVRCRLE